MSGRKKIPRPYTPGTRTGTKRESKRFCHEVHVFSSRHKRVVNCLLSVVDLQDQTAAHHRFAAAVSQSVNVHHNERLTLSV